MKKANKSIKKKGSRKQKRKAVLKIKKSMTIGEVIDKYPIAAEILLKEGLMCVACGMSRMETIEQGAMAHGIDVDALIEKLNKAIK